jgi:hypothetical protein
VTRRCSAPISVSRIGAHRTDFAAAVATLPDQSLTLLSRRLSAYRRDVGKKENAITLRPLEFRPMAGTPQMM